MIRKSSRNLLTRLNSNLKHNSMLRDNRILRLTLSCCYVLSYTIISINSAEAEMPMQKEIHSTESKKTEIKKEMHPNHNEKTSAPEMTHCNSNLAVDCFYVNDEGYLRLAGKSITVPGYWEFGWVSCWPKPNTFAAMDTACAALGTINGYTLFASSWEGRRMPKAGCGDVDPGSWWDSNNKVCGHGVYQKDSPHQPQVEMHKPAKGQQKPLKW